MTPLTLANLSPLEKDHGLRPSVVAYATDAVPKPHTVPELLCAGSGDRAPPRSQ